MVHNDAEAIGGYMADDWTIVGPDGSMSDKATFLGLVKSGALTHDVMESGDIRIRIYGDTAVSWREGYPEATIWVRRFERWSSHPTSL